MKHFSLEEQEVLRSYLFTSPHGDIGFVYPQELLSGEELAPIMSAVSRTHLSMQSRVLQFLDMAKEEQTRSMIPYIAGLMELYRNSDGSLKVFRKTSRFNKEWVLAHGHNSIKEGTSFFGHVENVSDVCIKSITGLPMNHPQVKSSRYIDFQATASLGLQDRDLLALPEPLRSDVLEHVSYMNLRYGWATTRLAEAVLKDERTEKIVEFLLRPEQVEIEVENWKKSEFRIEGVYPDEVAALNKREQVMSSLSPEGVAKDVRKFVFDYSRNWLLGATRTSGVFNVDGRTLEVMIGDLLSSPRREDAFTGEALWSEAQKIAPVLLGKRSHVEVSVWDRYQEGSLREWMQETFGSVPLKNNAQPKMKFVTRIGPSEIPEMFSDKFGAACIVFPYVDASLLDIYAQLSDSLVREVIDRAHETKSVWDGLHSSLDSGGLMWEFVMGYHAYRDVFRHRKGARMRQLLTTRLGFDVPVLVESAGIADEYMNDMQRCSVVYEQVRRVSPHVAELVVPFGANCRAVHSWSPAQAEYVAHLRSNQEKGHVLYVNALRELDTLIGELQPLTHRQFRTCRREYPLDLWKKGYAWYDAMRGCDNGN